MTIRELYEWGEKNNALDLDVEIQHRDSGGFYIGADDLENPEIIERYHSYNTEMVVNILRAIRTRRKHK